MQVTFRQSNGSRRQFANPGYPDNFYQSANLYSVTVPNIDSFSTVFGNTTLSYTNGGVPASLVLPNGVYTSADDIVADINLGLPAVLTAAVTNGNHVSVLALVPNIIITPNLLTRMLGFEDTQLTGAISQITPLVATNLFVPIPITGIIVESNKIDSNQWVTIDGVQEKRGFYYIPVGSAEFLVAGNKLFDRNSLGTDVTVGGGTVSGDWSFWWYGVGIDGTLYVLDFGNLNPSISIEFK